MSRILSKEEIDALLAVFTTSPEPVAKNQRSAANLKRGRAIPYDFKHPNRVSKDQVRKLETMHDSFATALGTSLSTVQRSLVDVALSSVEQITYTEFIASLKTPSCSYTFQMRPLDGPCILDIEPPLAFAMIDRMCGGPGDALRTRREMTVIERSVLERMAVRVLEHLAAGWHRVVDAVAEIVTFESNPQFLQVVAPGETVIVITLQVGMAVASGTLTFCYPYVALESVLKRLAAHRWTDRSRPSNPPAQRTSVERTIRRVSVSVDGQLLETEIALGDLLTIQPGSILSLPHGVGEAVILRVGSENKFTGTLGTVGRRRAVRIEGPLQSEGE